MNRNLHTNNLASEMAQIEKQRESWRQSLFQANTLATDSLNNPTNLHRLS